jgi:putative tryptophan/tyrosine transport system substrate-binding protein
MLDVRRRKFITLLGGAAAWPLAARAQQPAMPVLGFLNSGTPDGFARMLVAFHKELNETGYVEGRNTVLEYRWAQNHYDRLPALAAELVRRPVDVIAATGGITSALAAKGATSTLPIVFEIGGDPVKFGLVDSLNRPGGNITSIMLFISLLGAKRLELLRELVPGAGVVGVLANPTQAARQEAETRDVQDAARALGQQTTVLNAGVDSEIDEAFATLRRQGASALVVLADPFFVSRRDKFAAQAARYAVPTIYPLREFVAAGGLISYGTSITDVFRQTGVYTGRILRGEKPADLPIIQPTRFELVINLKTAKALGITVPLTLQVAADEVIE